MNPEVDELAAASLLDMRLRVWAEIGRTRMPAAFAVGMPEGAIVDLDCEPDEPADLHVHGRHFGTGRLVLVEGEWALRVETLNGAAAKDVEHASSADQHPDEADE